MSDESDLKKKVMDFEIRGIEPKPIAISNLHKSIKAEMRQLLKQWYGSDFEERHEIELMIAPAMKNMKDRELYKYNWAYYIWAFYADDEMELDDKVTAKWLEKVDAMHSNDDKPLDKMFNYFIDGFKSRLPRDALQKQMDIIKESVVINGSKSIREDALNDSSDVDIEDYLNARLADIYCGKGLMWIELNPSTNLTVFRNDEKINEILKQFDRNAGLAGVLYNEIYSAKKEVKQNVMKWNYVYIRMKKDGITAQEAVDAIVAEVKEYIRLMYAFGSELKRLGIQAINNYVDVVINVVEGFAYWGSVGGRYNDLSLYD